MPARLLARGHSEREALLRHLKFGKGGPDVSVIGQGTWYLDRGDRKAAVAALRRGIDLGMTHIDTAEMYGDAELVIADAIEGVREKLFLVSKVLPSNASRRGTITACERSLKRLKTDRLDCYLLHWRGSHPFEETVAAFDELMRRHQMSAMKVAVSIVRDKQDAEDEVQNAFWKAYEHIGQFQRDAKFSTWLTRIVVNQCLMRLRQMRRARFAYIDDPEGEDIAARDLRDLRPTPETLLGVSEVAAVLQQEIKHTPPLLRNVFLLRDVENKAMPEVAARLGISVAAAKSRLLRARTELRSRMRRHCGEIGPATLTS